MRGPTYFWTPEEDERLRAARTSGSTAGEIARTFGRSKAAVVKRASRIDAATPNNRRMRPAEVETIVRMLGAGATNAQIGKAIDRSVASIATWLSKNGLARKASIRALLAREADRIVDSIERGVHYTTIARRLGVSPDVVRRFAHDRGVLPPRPYLAKAVPLEREIEAMIDGGVSYAEIARRTGLSAATIHYRAKRHATILADRERHL